MNDRLSYVSTEHCQTPVATENLMDGREKFAQVQQNFNNIYVTIMVLAYNRLEKTKRCIESILEYTAEIDYELLLIDNGSADGTQDYFENLPYKNKKIVKISQNLGPIFPYCINSIVELGRYLVIVPNDIIVTSNWLNNLLICADSDPSIGLVCPSSSNSSNCQEVILDFNNYKEMQEKAAIYNHSDPKKWNERLRIIPFAFVIKKEALLAVGYPFVDVGFFHDFSDDDLAFRVRRAGYKVIFAADVWVHHDHDYRNGEDKDIDAFNKSLVIGRKNFKDKYMGIDAWDDVNNYLFDLKNLIKPPQRTQYPRILGIDVRCGTPPLEIKNRLREFGFFNAGLSAFTQDSKYEIDLKTICNDIVACDREEFLGDYFPLDYYDYVIIDRPINCYHEPQKILNDISKIAKKGAQVILSLHNTYSFFEYLNILGYRNIYSEQFAYNISLELFKETLEKTYQVEAITSRTFQLSQADEKFIKEQVRNTSKGADAEERFLRLVTENFLFVLKKL